MRVKRAVAYFQVLQQDIDTGEIFPLDIRFKLLLHFTDPCPKISIALCIEVRAVGFKQVLSLFFCSCLQLIPKVMQFH